MPYERDSAIERSLITAKLSKLRRYQRFLKELQATSIEDFVKDFKMRGLLRDTFKFLLNASRCRQ